MSSDRSFKLILIVWMAFLISACSQPTETANNPGELLFVEAQAARVSDSYTVLHEYVGSVHSAQKANLGFELAGKVSELWVDAGEVVFKGQLLISLDTQLLLTELKQLEAQLAEVKAEQDLTQANLLRQYSLKKKGFASESEIDRLISQRDALKAKVLRLNAEVSANRLKQEKSTIKAPYSGIISQRFVSLGDIVGLGQATFSLLSTDNKEAIIGINNDDIAAIESQGDFQIRIGETRYAADLVSSASNIDLNSRSISLRFLLEHAPAVLDGELAYLSYEKRYEAEGFWLPSAALTDGIRGTWNVFIINSIDRQKQVERRSVQVLFANNRSVYVQGAIADGDEVITAGLHKVVPGQFVQVSR